MERIIYLAVAILVTSLFASSAHAEWDNGSSACTRSAYKMRQSCTHEVHEEYRATLASCINFSDPGAELDCRDDAFCEVL